MYCERRILGAWLKSHFSSIFPFSHYNFHKFIWAPLSLIHQQHLDINNYKINNGKFIYHMYHERGILGVWKNLIFVHIEEFFSFPRYNWYKSIWAPLWLMYHQNLNVDIYEMHIGECISFIYQERGILGVWIKSHNLCKFPLFFDFLAIMYINWYERLCHWCTSETLILILIKSILGISFIVCITREKYWV